MHAYTIHAHSATHSRDSLYPVDFAVAMIAASQGEVVIDIERTIVKAEVNKNALTKHG